MSTNLVSRGVVRSGEMKRGPFNPGPLYLTRNSGVFTSQPRRYDPTGNKPVYESPALLFGLQPLLPISVSHVLPLWTPRSVSPSFCRTSDYRSKEEVLRSDVKNEAKGTLRLKNIFF